MKKVLFTAAIAAVAATSCTTTEEVDVRMNPATDGISFKAYTNGVSSDLFGKAEDVTTSNVVNQKFAITAYKTTGIFEDATNMSKAFMDDEVLVYGEPVAGNGNFWHTKSELDGAGSAPTIYFWPTASTDVMSFFATNAGFDKTTGYAASPLSNTANEYDKEVTQAYPAFDYTVQSTQPDKEMQDLLVASTLNGNKGAVALNFEHALAKLNFKAQGAKDGGWGVISTEQDADGNVIYTEGTIDNIYTVDAIKISGLYNKGTFTYADVAEGEVPGAWTAQAVDDTSVDYDTDKIIYDYDLTKTAEKSGKNTELFPLSFTDEANDVSNSLLLMPQTGNEITISVKYHVTKNGKIIYPLAADRTTYASVDDIPGDAGIETLTITLSDATFELKARSQVSITLVLPTPGDILTYKPDVEEWDDETEFGAEKDDAGTAKVFVKVTAVNDLVTTETYQSKDGSVKQSETVTTLSAADGYVAKVVETHYDIDAQTNYSTTTTNYSAEDVMDDETYEVYVGDKITRSRKITYTTDAAAVEVEEQTIYDYDNAGEMLTKTVTTTGTDVGGKTGATKSIAITTYTGGTEDTTTTTYFDVDGNDVSPIA